MYLCYDCMIQFHRGLYLVSFPLVTRDKSRRVTAKGMVLEGGWVMQTYLCVASVQGGTVSE